MPSSQIFQVPSYHSNLRAANSGSVRRKKRKRADAELEVEDEEEEPKPKDPFAIRSLTATQAEQYRLAGIHPSHGIPEYPFPHHDIPKLPHQDARKLSTGFTPTAFRDGSLRQRHLSVLCTIMYQSLLKRDWKRAGRAWAMLMRSGPAAMRLSQTTMDLHRDGRWEVAAEILLRKRPLEGHDTESDIGDSSFSGLGTIFNERSVRMARDFYQRLIVQFPIHPARTNTQPDFYLAMFSLWIYELSEKAKANRQRLLQQPRGRGREFENFDQDSSSNSPDSEDSGAQVREVQSEEIKGAQEIANRLDELLSSPPYDKDPRFLHLRGCVALWLADLADNERGTELQRADDYFARALAKGGRM